MISNAFNLAVNKRFGENLRELRLNKKLAQIDLAVATGLNRTYIGKLENGYARVTLQTLICLSKGLHINMKELVKNIEN